MTHGNNIAALIGALEESDKRTIRKAVDALITFATDDAQLRTTLSGLLTDASRKNRWPLAYILANLLPPEPAGLAVLIETLDHSDPDIRWAIALTLIRLAKTDAKILNLLIDLASTGSANQRRMAIYCLRGVGLNDDGSVQTLLKSLYDPDPMTRVAAVISLKIHSRLGEQGKRELFERFLNDPDVRVRSAAAVILAHLGNPSQEFLAALTKASVDGNPQLKKAATTALALLQKKRSAPRGS
jgi:HEAT repeat protein